MLRMVLGWLGNLLGGPFAKAAVDAYKAKLTSENSSEKTAADLAARELAVQQREAELSTQLKIAEIGHPWEPEKLAFYITLAYYAKIVVWDIMLGMGSTDALRGQAAAWAQMIMAFYFVKRGAENVTRILKR